MKMEAGVGRRWPPTPGSAWSQQPLVDGRKEPPDSSSGSVAANTLILGFSSQNCDRMNFCVESPQLVVLCHGGPRTLTQATLGGHGGHPQMRNWEGSILADEVVVGSPAPSV